MPLAISVISRREQRQLGPQSSVASPEIVPAENLTFKIEGAEVPESAKLDARTVPLVRNDEHTRGCFILDAFRSVGFHRLVVAAHTCYFATEDGKLRLAGIQQLLEVIGRQGLSWSHQIFFADGTSIRDPRVDYAWLSDRANGICDVARAISERPISGVGA